MAPVWLFPIFAAVADVPPPPPAATPRASIAVTLRIVRAAEVRGGRTDQPHQRRTRPGPDGHPERLIEFE